MSRDDIKDANSFREALIGVANYMAAYNKEVCAFVEPIEVIGGMEGTAGYEGKKLAVLTLALVNRTEY